MRGALLPLLLLVACAALVSADYTPAAQADEITALPGLSAPPPFRQFAGYLQVDAASNRSLFYWYVEASGVAAESAPLLWWSNGGPGCSGLMGFLTQHGPFRPDGNGGLQPFDYAWNRLVNALYVEAPAGVGFSYSLNSSDYIVGDNRTALDNANALLAFYEKFPQMRSNALILSAESYGGHYVPELATLLISPAFADQFPQLAGFFLGNPLTDMFENMVNGMAATLCGRSLASQPTCAAFHQNCIANLTLDSALECELDLVGVILEAGALDLYGLGYPKCPASGRERRLLGEARQFFQRLLAFPISEEEEAAGAVSEEHANAIRFLKGIRRAFEKHPNGRKVLRSLRKAASAAARGAAPPPYDPCMTEQETVYLNRDDVRQALHVSPHAAATWTQCAGFDRLLYNRLEMLLPMQPLYAPLIARGNLALTIFSGDDDAVCATLGTQSWMYTLFNGTQGPWQQWHYESEAYGRQIGGSRVQFEGITLATVHAAGHMVSSYQPERGFAVFENYMTGNFSSLPRRPVPDTTAAATPAPVEEVLVDARVAQE